MPKSIITTGTVAGTNGETPTRPDYSDIRNQYVNLLGTINAAYNQLLTAGRDNDAFALRDAMERMSRAPGGNAWSRLQAANDLRARMAAAARVLQGTTTAQALSAQGGVLGQIANLDQATFNDMIRGGQFDLQKQQLAFNEQQAKQDAVIRQNQERRASEAWDIQKQQEKAREKEIYDQTHGIVRSGNMAPVATAKTSETLSTLQPSSPYVTEVVPQWYKDQTDYQNKYNSGSYHWPTYRAP
jgi:hypothetical protein